MSKTLHPHLFWLYGLLIGLALEQVLVAAIPHLLDTTAANPWHGATDGCRLVVFLAIAARFFLGSVVYYEAAYFNGDAETSTDRYRYDYLSGFIHFLLIFVWGITFRIGIEDEVIAGAATNTPFLVMLAAILLYDLGWAFFSRGSPGYGTIRLWAVINLVTVCAGALAYLMAYVSGRPTLGECLALGVVVLASLIDMAGMLKNKDLVAEWLVDLGLKGQQPAVSPVAAPVTKSD